MEGEGIKYYSNGIYKGQFKNNEENDEKGEYEWSLTGTKYVGNWKDGARNGNGKIMWTDGSYYEGNFQNSKFDG
jgi:hypothetical protein